jgi:hypothetical protein
MSNPEGVNVDNVRKKKSFGQELEKIKSGSPHKVKTNPVAPFQAWRISQRHNRGLPRRILNVSRILVKLKYLFLSKYLELWPRAQRHYKNYTALHLWKNFNYSLQI